MKFSTREEIDAPVQDVWKAVTDTATFEERARGKGVQVTAGQEADALKPGDSWSAEFDFHGMSRKMEVNVTNLKAPVAYDIASRVSGVNSLLSVQLEALPKDRTRMALALDLTPASVPGRVLIQTLKLAKATLDKRFRRAIRRFAKDLGRKDHAG
ncbi:polyketide cyclase/dehydrase/lipid transport protein [Aliiruegeria haliotis]|uniref:Polyketide cyclase/dehydrase/lipid transport protein n=1 Tax=Aliiruegeria haliotis TaxID=1280846 RepID=A0A2T0RPS8_9RHOB|nr:SRPBCC family protein [Aliiruegeria haliotis]PRY23110.1 polyketide cyclase/dehydrase/lipid transport protein [Aliiruegeria haliotis]